MSCFSNLIAIFRRKPATVADDAPHPAEPAANQVDAVAHISTAPEDTSPPTQMVAGNFSKQPSGAADHSSRKVPANPTGMNLSHFAKVITDNVELREACDKLVKATEELEKLLQGEGQSSSEKLPQLKSELENLDPNDIPQSLSFLTYSVQSDQKSQDETLGGSTGRFFAALSPMLNMTLGYAGFAASAAGFAPVETAANGLMKVFELATSPHAQDESVKSGLDKISREDAFLKELYQFSTDDMPDFMLIGAVKLQTALMDFLRISIEWLRTNYWKKLGKVFVSPSHIKDAIVAMETARSALTTSTIDEAYLINKRAAIREVQRGLLKNICSPEFLDAQLDARAKFHEIRATNTCQWFVRDKRFSEWCAGAYSVLWCPGYAGAGKSCLTSSVLDHVESYVAGDDIGLAYLFCQRGRRNEQSSKSVLGLIIRQLIACKPKLCDDKKLQKQLEAKVISNETLESILRSIAKKFKGIILVVDALDEFSNNHDLGLGLIESLMSLSQEMNVGAFRVFLTSQPAPDVWQKIEPLNSLGRSIRARQIPISAVEADVAAMVDKDLKGKPHARALMMDDYKGRTLRDHAVKCLVEKSGGVFKLASLQLERTLRKGNVPGMVACLEVLSTDIDDYYSEAIERVKKNDESELLFRLLAWVLYAKTPLRKQQLEFGLAIEGNSIRTEDIGTMAYKDIGFYVSQTEGLLDIIKTAHDQDGVVSTAHSTISDFLARNPTVLCSAGEELVWQACIAFWSCEPFSGFLPELFCLDADPYGGRRERISDLQNEWTASHAQQEGWTHCLKANEFALWACHMPEWLSYERLESGHSEDDLVKFLHRISKLRASSETYSEPLDWCVWNDWDVLCSWFLSHDCGGNIDERGSELLDLAMTYPSIRTAMVLAAARSVDASSSVRRQTPLVRAVQPDLDFDLNDVARILVNRPDVDVNATVNGRQTALHKAAMSRNATAVEILLSHPGIHVNALDKKDMTPLMLAVLFVNQYEVNKAKRTLELLLARQDTAINARAHGGRTAVSIAAGYGITNLKWYELIAPKTQNEEFLTKGLHHINDYLAWNPVQQLVNAQADLNLPDRGDHSPLDYAYAFDTYVARLAPTENIPQENGIGASASETEPERSQSTSSPDNGVLLLYQDLRRSTKSMIKYLIDNGARSSKPIDPKRLGI